MQEADRKKKLAVFHIFRERIGKRRGYSPQNSGRGHPREPFAKISAQKERLASQSAYEVDRVTDPVPTREGGKRELRNGRAQEGGSLHATTGIQRK